MRGVGRGRADYNEWGEITYREALTITSSYRRIYPQSSYTGHDWDDVLGMYYAKARFYSAEDKRFVAVDPVLNAAQFDLQKLDVNLLWFSPYVYVFDRPLVLIDPDGEMPVIALNILKKLYSLNVLDILDVTALTISLNGGNLDTAFHEIAQLNLAKHLHNKGYSVTLEESVGQNKEADVAIPGYIWEVKPITQIDSKEPLTQLQEYLDLSGKKPGWYIGLTNIRLPGNIYMGIQGSYVNKGMEYYYFYQYDCDEKEVQIEAATVKDTVIQYTTAATALAASIVVATVAEDALTGGVGLIDDALSIIAAARIAKLAMFGW